MLQKLEILNGDITPIFNPNILEYEVVVSSTTFSLQLNYEINEGATVTIYGNDYLTVGEGHVLIEVYENGVVNTYTLNIYKEASEVSNIYNNIAKVEVVDKSSEMLEKIRDPLIGGVYLLIIIVLFSIIFKRK